MSYGELEIVSGHVDGSVIVWWAATRMIMLQVQTSNPSFRTESIVGIDILCVSYGKLKIVSGHVDGSVIVWWAATGMIMLQVR